MCIIILFKAKCNLTAGIKILLINLLIVFIFNSESFPHSDHNNPESNCNNVSSAGSIENINNAGSLAEDYSDIEIPEDALCETTGDKCHCCESGYCGINKSNCYINGECSFKCSHHGKEVKNELSFNVTYNIPVFIFQSSNLPKEQGKDLSRRPNSSGLKNFSTPIFIAYRSILI
jgi:hypothetical protein